MKGILAVFLPDPERAELARQSTVDGPLLSFWIGFLEFFGFGGYLVHDGMTFMRRVVDGNAALFLEHAQVDTFDEQLALNWSGALGWLIWLLRPLTWFLVLQMTTGIGRMLTFGISRQVLGEPLVLAGLRIAQGLRAAASGSRRKVREGPLRRDRWQQEEDGTLVLLTCREKTDWNEYVTIEIGERFFRLNRMELREDGPWRAYAYLLRESDSGEVIRSLVRYEPTIPDSSPGTDRS